MANPTLIAFSEADNGTGSGTSQASASLTWQTGDILACLGGNSGGNETWSAPTNTGSGLSWVQQQLHNSNGTSTQGAGAGCWTAVASAGSSGTVSINAGAADQLAVGVYQFRAPSGFTIGVGHSNLAFALTGAADTVAVTMTSVDSAVCWAAFDFGARPIGSATPAATSHSAASPGPFPSPFSATYGTAYSLFFGDLDDETLTGSQSFGLSGESAPVLTVVAVEVTLTAAAAGASQFPHRAPRA